MRTLKRSTLLPLVALAGLALSPLAVSHLNDKEPLQSYRQSWFAMVGMNFGPMVAMVKGEIPWDEQQVAAYTEQLATLTALNVIRSFAEGSEKGTTRAKPEIWENSEDFGKKMQDMKTAVNALQAAVNEGADRQAIAGGVGEVGKACKSCHDEYKSEDYLY